MIVFLLTLISIGAISSIEIEQLPKQFQVYENSPNGTIIGSIRIYPRNSQMTLIDDANGRFHLNSVGQLITIDQSRLNYEEQNQYHIRIQFSNQSDIFEKEFSIDIKDINEPPYNLQCCNQTGFCTAFDEDFNQTLTFRINYLPDEISCTDNGQPPLSVTIGLNILPDNLAIIFVPIYSLIIPVDTARNNETNDNIVIFYSNDGNKTERQRRQANSPPQDIYFNMFSLTIPENSRDFELANVYVVDEENDNYTCSIHTDHVGDDQQPFEINNGILKTSRIINNNHNYDLNFETVPMYNSTVTCFDPIHYFTITKNISITVDDVNEAPVELQLIPDTFPENSLRGYVIGRFHTVDPDISAMNRTFEYTIATDPNRLFRIENDQLILNRENNVEMCISQPNLCPHDYEQKTSLYIRINVEDNGRPRASEKFWIQIHIIDENDPPVNLQLDAHMIKENSPIGTLIGSFAVQDEDFYQTHTFVLLKETPLMIEGNFFLIEDNDLRLVRSPDYEQEKFILITVQAIDNGTIPRNVTRDFLIEIIDVDEPPNTYVFLSNINGNLSSNIINDLINGKQPVRTVYLPQNAYYQNSLGRMLFLMEDRDREIDLTGLSSTNELNFSKPTCEILSDIPYRLLCSSIVAVINPQSSYNNNDEDGHVVTTTLILTSNERNTTFPKPLRIKFENITLTIDDKPIEAISIRKDSAMGYQIGIIHAIDLAAAGQPERNVTLNSNDSLSYPLEIVNSTILKIRDDVNLSSINSSLIFNVSVLITTTDEDSRVIEKHLIVYLQDKRDFNLTLSNDKIMENSHENTFIGDLNLENGIGDLNLENGIGDYNMELVDDANGKFKLNGSILLTARKYFPHCHVNHSCPLDHETEPILNITIEIRDPSTNETLRLIDLPIEIEDENESPYNLTLSTQSIPENIIIGSVVGLLNAIDDDFNQTLTYSTDNAIFSIVNNTFILTMPLNYDSQQFIPLMIRATDNGQPPEFTEKRFIIGVTAVNQPPINVTSDPMTVYYPSNSDSTPMIVGQIHIIDPDVKENFTITFNHSNYRALTPATNTYSIISDDGHVIYAQIYNISIEDLNPPVVGYDNVDSPVNVVTNITDSAGHSISHQFLVNYILRPIVNATIISTIPPPSTTSASIFQGLHIRIYETIPPNTPIIRGLLRPHSSNNVSPICTVIDDEMSLFPIHTTQSSFLISLPTTYTLNSRIRSTILLHVECHISNDTNVNQDIVIDVLPAPPTIQINFNQTKSFDITNNDTILGTLSLIELTTIPTNRTYNLSLINPQDIFQLLPNNSLIQIGSCPSNLLQIENPYINITIQAVEITPNEPTRIIQRTFSIPILVNTSSPFLRFSRTSIPNDTNPNTIIGNLTTHNIPTHYRLDLIDTYNHGLEFNADTNTIILKRPIGTFPLINNQTQLLIKTALMNETNGTVLTAIFPLNITYPMSIDLCSDRNCNNGTCIQSNESFSYCLCTSGYRGIDCRTIDSCAYNPCVNNGVCQQLTSAGGDFVCQCLPNHSGSLCQRLINVCQVNTSLCLATEICIPNENNNNVTNFFTCVSQDELQYFVFDYLKEWKEIEVMNDANLSKEIEDFIQKNLFPVENLILFERKILGPEQYNRAELLSVAIPSSNTTLNDTLDVFCANQSLIIDRFAREICDGYQQAIHLQRYFQSTPTFCPNCSFADAADKFYWFDRVIPFLPLWITLIVGTLLMAAIPLLPFNPNAPKKVALPLMKAGIHPEDENEIDIPVLAKSVRTAVKFSRYSSRERNDSGYESNEETENYLEQIIANHQQEQQQIHVYPLLHAPRSPNVVRQGTTIDDLISSHRTAPASRSISSANVSRRYPQRSASMSGQKSRRQSSIGNSQTLKPIIQRRSTILDSNAEPFMPLRSSSRSNNNNNDDDTYVSSRFRNENTSKFVIGTLWNTFALVNNLFLQRPRRRRNAISDEDIRAEQLVHLQRLYSLAERNQDDEFPTNNLQSIIREALLEPETNNLQSIIFDILSTNDNKRCSCYGNHHVRSCVYYDHSLPYIKRYLDNTSELERIFYDIQRANKPKVQDASTQSAIEKPMRTFTHAKSTTNIATQSSPIAVPTRLHLNVATQCSPIGNHINDLMQFNSDSLKSHNYINISTQTSNNLNEISTESKPKPIEYTNILPRINAKDQTYINTSNRFSSTENEDADVPEEILPKKTTRQFTNNKFADDNINDRRNSLMNELKEVITSRPRLTTEENTFLPNHTVRSLVSMFETTSPIMRKSNLFFPEKFITHHSEVLTPSDGSLININMEKIHSPMANDTIEQYADDIASNIVDNAVLTATTTTVHHNEQLQRRFSLYRNGGGYGKNLLFQSNTFVPPKEFIHQEVDLHLRAESQSSSAVLNDRVSSIIPPFHPEDEIQQTLIVGRYVDGSSSSSEEEPIDPPQFLSNSQLFSAQELYIRPWLVRRATAPEIHCLDNNITDTRVEIIDSFEAYFSVFPKNNNPSNIYTRFTCLITILFYLRDIHDDNCNRLLYDEIDRIEKQFISPTSTPFPRIHSNSFQTINPDGSKRYRTGFIIDINSFPLINRRKILAQQIEWKCVKILVRRFRKKYRYYKQLMKTDEKNPSNHLNIEHYLNYFDSTSKRRIKKYAKHYAEKL